MCCKLEWRIALLVYLSITFWVNLIANVVINGAIAVGVYCCTDNSVPLVGTTLSSALQGVLDYSITAVWCIAFSTYVINGAWAARDVRIMFWGLRGWPRPDWMINHPIKKFFADMFYVNDVLNFKKDCCRDPHGECHGWRTTFKWILLLTKGFFFSFIILFLMSIPGVPILVSLDKTNAVTWDIIAMILLQMIMGGLLGGVLSVMIVFFALFRNKKDLKEEEELEAELEDPGETLKEYDMVSGSSDSADDKL